MDALATELTLLRLYGYSVCRKNAFSWGCPHVDYEDIADTRMHQSTKRGNPVTGYTKVKINKILE